MIKFILINNKQNKFFINKIENIEILKSMNNFTDKLEN